MRNVKTDLKVGDRVIVKGNAFNPGRREETRVLDIGYWPSMWLPRGEKRWGATVEFETMYINPDYDAGVPGAPEEIPGMMESGPMIEEQWSYNEQDGVWELQLL